MPQLDKVLFTHNIFWFLVFFIFIYFFSYIYFILTILTIIKNPIYTLKIFYNSITTNIITTRKILVVIENILLTVFTLIPILIIIAFYTLAERKIIAAIQRRRGPNVVGLIGLLQPFADGLKLVLKEVILPKRANKIFFLLAPLLTLTLSFLNWSLISFSFFDIIVDLNLSLLILFAISSFSVYGLILSGWASNSRYPFLGALRSASQIISYEVSLTVIFLLIAAISSSFNIVDIIHIQNQTHWFIFPLFPLFVIFIISMLAETNRAPFDLPEAEAEIVAGYNLEYSSIIFAIFFLGEYSNIILMATVLSVLFFGGWSTPIDLETFYLHSLSLEPLFMYQNIVFFNYYFYELFFCIKIIFICFIFILIRATFPRIRYDQLITLGWKILLPLTCSFYFYYVGWICSSGTNLNFIQQISPNIIINLYNNI